MFKLLKFFILLIVFSLPLFWFWFAGGQSYYTKFVGQFTARLMIHLQKIPQGPVLKSYYPSLLEIVKAHYMNVIPFVALMLAVPALGWKKRLAGLGIGLAILFLAQILFTMVLSHFLWRLGRTPEFHRILLPLFSISDSMPVILWLFLAWPGAKLLLGEIFVRPAPAPLPKN